MTLALAIVTLALTLLPRPARAQDTLSVARLQEAAVRSDPPASAPCCAPPPTCASR